MKSIKRIITILLVLITYWSCEKEGELIIVSGFEASELSSDNSDIILTPEKNTTAVLAFAWTESNLTLSNGKMSIPTTVNVPADLIEVSATSGFEISITVNPTANPHIFSGLALNTLAKNLLLESGKRSPMYFRVNSTLGKNTTSKYSNVITVYVTPFTIDMSKGFILNSSKVETGSLLYSPNSNGEYSGFMNVTAWYNWYLKEGDGSIWGNVPESGKEFLITNNTGAQWNLWFPGQGGCYYTTINTKSKQWSATHMPSLTVSGDVTGNMTFVKSEFYWMLSFTTTQTNAKFKVKGNAKLYNNSTLTNDAAAIGKTITFTPGPGNALTFNFNDQTTEFTVPSAGEYTLKLFLSDPSNLNYSITQGSVVIKDPISEFLYLPGVDDGITGGPWNFNNYISLISDVDSTFAGVVNVNSLWGFIMSLKVNEWSDVYKMGSTAGKLAFKGSSNIPAPAPGLYLIKADLKNLTYSHTQVTKLSHAGLNNNWSLTDMGESVVAGVYTSSVTISNPSQWGCKLYLNGGWDEFFGGKNGVLKYKSDGITDDATLVAGTYDFIANLKSSTYTFLGNEVYITGLNNVWDFTSVVLTKTSTGVYSGTATINAPSPWGMAIHIDKSWNRYFGGSFTSLKFLGANINNVQSLANGTYNVTVDFINNTCTFVVQ